jgi:hypothetical protein
MKMDWKQIQEKLEMVINTNRQDNTVKTRVDLPNITIYNIPKQDVVRIDIKAK